MFLTALDSTIVGTALPRIVSQFKALDRVSWIASACECHPSIPLGTVECRIYSLLHADFLTQAGFMLFYGQLLAIAPTKWVFMSSIFIFEVGSLVCAIAPSMTVLILGRAVSLRHLFPVFPSPLSLLLITDAGYHADRGLGRCGDNSVCSVDSRAGDAS